MLTKRKKTKKFTCTTGKPFSLIIFFYLTHNDRDAKEKLMPLFQAYHLTWERFKGKGNHLLTKDLPFSCPNANFVAWSHAFLTPKDCLFLSQALPSEINILAFCYNKHLWTSSRLKQIPKSAAQISDTNMSTQTVFWKYFSQYTF